MENIFVSLILKIEHFMSEYTPKKSETSEKMEFKAKKFDNIPSGHTLLVRCHLGDAVVEIPQSNHKNSKYIFKSSYEVEESCDFKMRTVIIISMNSSLDDMLFVKLVNNITDVYEFYEIMDILALGNGFFDLMELTQKTICKIQNWINRLGRSSYVWNNLTNKPDYNLELQKKRFYPFYHIKNKEWKEISSEARENKDYPPTNSKIFEQGNDDGKDFITEKAISQKHNNFMSYPVLNPSKYGNIKKVSNCLKILIDLDLKHEAMEAFLRLCLTPSYCHIIKYPDVWKLITPLIDNIHAKNIMLYVVYYAQYILRHESTKMFSQVQRSYRVLWTYSELRIQPDAHDAHIERDPYIQQLPDDTFISQTVPFYLREKRIINAPNIFDRRLFLATGGALVDVDLKALKASLSGSILIPCITQSPLEERFEGIRIDPIRKIRGYIPTHCSDYYGLTEQDLDFLSYLEYFYPSYDSLKDHEYIKEVLTEKNEKIVKFDMKSYIEKKEREEVPDYKDDRMPDYNKLADMDISLTTHTFDDFREKAMELFKQIEKNVQFRGPIWIIEIETLSSFKFKIYGPGLLRPIDLFRVPYDASKMVKKFHVPCVRMWFEGKQETKFSEEKISTDPKTVNGIIVYDSCLRALKSGINDSYKWFSCNKIPADVILKYAQRGITTVLNKKERQALEAYMLIGKRWKELLEINPDGKLDSNHMDIFGVMTDKHKFFYPAQFNSGIRMNLRNNMFVEDNSFYSKRQSVNYPSHGTKYGGDLAIKTNNSVNPPKLENITRYIRYCKDDEWLSDNDE